MPGGRQAPGSQGMLPAWLGRGHPGTVRPRPRPLPSGSSLGRGQGEGAAFSSAARTALRHEPWAPPGPSAAGARPQPPRAWAAALPRACACLPGGCSARTSPSGLGGGRCPAHPALLRPAGPRSPRGRGQRPGLAEAGTPRPTRRAPAALGSAAAAPKAPLPSGQSPTSPGAVRADSSAASAALQPRLASPRRREQWQQPRAGAGAALRARQAGRPGAELPPSAPPSAPARERLVALRSRGPSCLCCPGPRDWLQRGREPAGPSPGLCVACAPAWLSPALAPVPRGAAPPRARRLEAWGKLAELGSARRWIWAASWGRRVRDPGPHSEPHGPAVRGSQLAAGLGACVRACMSVHGRVFVCVCLYECACVHTCVHACACMSVCICMCMHERLSVHVCVHVCPRVNVCLHERVHVPECVCMCAFACKCVCLYVCMSECACVHVPSCVNVCLRVRACI